MAGERGSQARLLDLARRMAEACAIAHQHLDTYGTVSGGHEAEMASQKRAFEALGQFTQPVGHRMCPIEIGADAPAGSDNPPVEEWATDPYSDPAPMTLADRLRRVIPDRGFTIAEVAKLAGMSRQALHQITSGANAAPTVSTCQRIADALGLTLAELFEGVGEGTR